MHKDEYRKRIEGIESRANKAKQTLYKEYAFSNNPYETGDIVKDHKCIIEIKQIKVMMSIRPSGYPECYYRGPKLRKDLTPYKSGEFESICQSNIEG